MPPRISPRAVADASPYASCLGGWQAVNLRRLIEAQIACFQHDSEGRYRPQVSEL
jgi:hypothetical protein